MSTSRNAALFVCAWVKIPCGQLARKGFNVYCVDMKPKKIPRLTRNVRVYPHTLEYIQKLMETKDLKQPAAIEEMARFHRIATSPQEHL